MNSHEKNLREFLDIYLEIEALQAPEARILSKLSKDLGVDMRQVIKPAEHYAQFFHTPRECCTFEQLDAYAHGKPLDGVAQHLTECNMCLDVVELIRKSSFKLHPEKSTFERFWKKRVPS